MREIFFYSEKQYLVDETHKANSYKPKEEIAKIIEQVFPGNLPNFTFEITKENNILRCIITGDDNKNISINQLPLLAKQFYHKIINKHLKEV